MTGAVWTPDPDLTQRPGMGGGARHMVRVSRAMIRSRPVCTPPSVPLPSRSTLPERTQLGGLGVGLGQSFQHTLPFYLVTVSISRDPFIWIYI